MSAVDKFVQYDPGMLFPATHAEAITTSDSADLPYVTRAIYVGGTGDMVVIMQGGETVTFSAVPAGTTLSVRVTRVKATSTTATNLVGLY